MQKGPNKCLVAERQGSLNTLKPLQPWWLMLSGLTASARPPANHTKTRPFTTSFAHNCSPCPCTCAATVGEDIATQAASFVAYDVAVTYLKQNLVRFVALRKEGGYRFFKQVQELMGVPSTFNGPQDEGSSSYARR